jgi:predicted nuclease with TOPRIM domain
MKTVKVTILDLELIFDDRELNIVRSALLEYAKLTEYPDVKKLAEELEFKIFRIQQRASKPEVTL